MFMDDFVAKPFEIDEVLTKIAKHVLPVDAIEPLRWKSKLLSTSSPHFNHPTLHESGSCKK